MKKVLLVALLVAAPVSMMIAQCSNGKCTHSSKSSCNGCNKSCGSCKSCNGCR